MSDSLSREAGIAPTLNITHMIQKDLTSVPIHGSGPTHSWGYLAEVLEILFLVSKGCGISREGGTRSEVMTLRERSPQISRCFTH